MRSLYNILKKKEIKLNKRHVNQNFKLISSFSSLYVRLKVESCVILYMF